MSAAQELAGVEGTVSKAVFVRNCGTTVVSTLTAAVLPLSVTRMPGPEVMNFDERKARWSAPPFASQVPFVAVQVASGIESGGKAGTVLLAMQLEHVRLRLCATFKEPSRAA